MKIKLVTFIAALAALSLTGCVSNSVPADPTPKQEVIANAVEDSLAIGLTPVFVNNPDYLAAADAVAAALGSVSGDVLTPEGVKAFLANPAFKLKDVDQATIAALVNVAWDTYCKRYKAQVNASVRPDVKLFLTAVASGIHRAVNSVPKSVKVARETDRYNLRRIADWIASYCADPGDSMSVADWTTWKRVENEMRQRARLL